MSCLTRKVLSCSNTATVLERGSPKLGEDGKLVSKNGKLVYEPYKIKVLNTINFKKIHAVQSLRLSARAKRIF